MEQVLVLGLVDLQTALDQIQWDHKGVGGAAAEDATDTAQGEVLGAAEFARVLRVCNGGGGGGDLATFNRLGIHHRGGGIASGRRQGGAEWRVPGSFKEAGEHLVSVLVLKGRLKVYGPPIISYVPRTCALSNYICVYGLGNQLLWAFIGYITACPDLRGAGLTRKSEIR